MRRVPGIFEEMFRAGGTRNCGVCSRHAESEAEPNFGGSLGLQKIVPEMAEAIPINLEMGETDGIGTLRAFPKVVGHRALGNHTHTFLNGQG